MIPKNITEEKHVEEYLVSRQLLSQYKKAKISVLAGQHTGTYFKERHPKGCGIWYFRINQKYRAWCRWIGGELVVFSIDDHQ